MAQVALPFEVRAARDYARLYDVPWRPLDLGAPSRRHLPRYARELLSLENLKALLATEDAPLEDYVAGEYQRARLAGRRPRWRPLGASPETRAPGTAPGPAAAAASGQVWPGGPPGGLGAPGVLAGGNRALAGAGGPQTLAVVSG